MSLECNLAVSISNRPFAHCVKFSESETSLFAFFTFKKAREIFYQLLYSLICYKDIITNL